MNRNNWVAFLPMYLLVVIAFIGLAKGGSEAVTVIYNQQPLQRQRTFVIDAGHGGIDGGATSCTGVLESMLNLQIALRLEDMMHLLGMNTVMIRRTDTSVYTQGTTIAAQKVSDLKERVRIINDTPNAILVSIHQNTFSDSRYDGAQVFYAPDDNSRGLAEVMQNSLIQTLNPDSKRAPKNSKGIYLMQNISRRGILIECGFLSNPEEEAKLRNDTYQISLCGVIAATLSAYANP